MVNMDNIIISGTGCALADYLYTGVRFNSPQFQKYSSKKSGDGGLSPGKLVFTEEIESLSGNPYSLILKELAGDRPPDGFNIGGPGLVSMINVSQLLRNDEFTVRFYGGRGDDKTATALSKKIKNNIPLDISNYLIVSNKPTPFTDVLSDSTFNQGQGERTFINNIGAAWDYSPDFLDDDFFKSHVVCFGGTALVPHIHDNLDSLLSKAKKNGCLTVVNTVFDFRNEKKNPGKPWPLCKKEEVYKLVDLLIMDCEEALKISGKPTMGHAAEFFANLDVGSFIITNGAEDLVAFSNGSLFKKQEIMRLPVSNKVSGDLKNCSSLQGDTTGCGDNFVGGAVASLASQLKNNSTGNFDFNEMLAWAVASGGFACFYLGGTFFEKEQGEKRSKILAYKNEYFKQISSL